MTHPVIGTALSVTNGSWSNSPLSYGYQWERCNGAGAECVAILGSTNQTYTPIMGDRGHTLVAEVTATDADGAAVAASTASSVVPIALPGYFATFGSSGSGSSQLSQPVGTALAPNGSGWVADASNHRLDEFSPSGVFMEALGWGVSNGKEELQTCTSSCKIGLTGEHSGFDRPEGIAINQTTGVMFVTDAAADRIQEFGPSGKYEFGFGPWGEQPFSGPHGIALDSSGDVWVAYSGDDKIVEYKTDGEIIKEYGAAGKGLGQFEHLSGLAFAGGNLYATDLEGQRVQELKPSTGEWVREFGNTGGEAEKVSNPSAIATDEANGDLYVTSAATGRVQAFTQEGKYVERFGAFGSEHEELEYPGGIAINPTSGTIYIGDEGNNRVDIWAPTGPTEEPVQPPPSLGTSAVTTIEYQVPLSGSELQTMTKSEVAKWGQSDVPVEATAIFPPDTPMGWPANAYKRATVEYLDGQGRTVNVASPTGGVSTSEFNKYNDVTRSLSPDNRAAALKEGCVSESSCKSAEVSKVLDTQSTYEEGGSEPGSELLSTLGPQHAIGLPNGTHVEARAHMVDSYNEGAPAEGGPYHLVTKTTQGAMVAGKEEPETVRTAVMSYSGTGSQEGLGWKLRRPISVTTDPSGLDLVHTSEYNPSTGEVVQTKMPAAAGKDTKVPPTYVAQFGAKGTGAGQLEQPTYDAVDAHGDTWVVEYGDDRLSEFSPSGAFMETVGWGVSNGEAKLEVCTASCKAGIAGTGKGQLAEPDGIAIAGGDIYVVDTGNARIEVLNEKGEWVTQWGSLGTGAGQFKTPLAIAVSPTGKVWVGDSINRRVQEFSSTGTFIEAIGWGVSNGKSEYQVCTSSCQAGINGSGNGQFSAAWGMAFAGSNLYVADTSNNRVQEFNEKSEYVAQFGSTGSGNGQFKFPTGVAVSPTTGLLYVTDTNNNRMQVFTQSGSYLTQFASAGAGNGQLQFPEGNAINATGEVIVVDDLNHRVEKWVPTITGNEGAHDTKTVYYTAKEEAEVPACRNHPEWAGLPCQTGPAAQPGGGLPELPVTTFSAYNVFEEPETIVETVGSTTRTKTDTFDAAGRPKTQSTSSTVGTAVPTVTDGYTAETGAETGAMTTQSTTVEGKTEKVTSVLNTLGELVSYTDADGATSTFEWDIDGRPNKTYDGKGTQTFSYSETTGLLSELVDSSREGMKFTATWDVEGNMLTEGYPNGMTAFYTRNSTGTATGLEYKKLTHCTEEKEKCKWFTDSVVLSIQGQWLSQTSTLSKQVYKDDAAGRLIEVQNTPAGKGCTSRIYAQDEDTNRTSLTTRESATEKCATEGGTLENHTYSSADQLTDSGTAYNPFGDITTLPASDAGGKEPSEALTSAFYVDNQVASQTQNGQTFGYNLDPAGRTRETVATGKKVSDIISHYAGPGQSPSWTTSTSGETSRDIPGIGGELAAIQNNSEAPVLELANLHGDTIATASLSETATELVSKTDTSEFGVPTTTTPPKYSWLGALELPTELASGVISMGARSYVPQIGRFLQPDPVPGGSANAYSYTFGDPVDSFDPTGEYVEGAYLYAFNDAENERAIEREAAREAARAAAAKAAAEAAAREAAEAAASAAGPQYAAEEGPLGGYAGWACEYAAETGQQAAGCGGVGLGSFASHEDPGQAPGASCEGSVDSKKYKKEHPKLCHEIESNPWEPVYAWCYLFPNPVCNVAEKVRETKH